MRTLVLAAFLLTFAPAAAMAGSCAAPDPIRFQAGTSQGRIEGEIARGELECRKLWAKAGQTMSLAITGAQENAVFAVYAPGWKTRRDRDGVFVFSGGALPGAGEGDDAKGWSGALPTTGEYLVVVGMTRGGGDFRLDIAIR